MVKKTTSKVSKVTKKSTTKKVDIEPNKMSLAVASLAAVSLVLLAIIAMYI